MQRQRGLTLLELLVVLAIIGLAMAGISLSLRDSGQTQIEREAQRLVAVLEAARAQSRTSGVALVWQATAEGFVIRPAALTTGNAPNTPTSQTTNPRTPRTEAWLTSGTQALVSTSATAAPLNLVVLGPEPILAPARITLSVATHAANTAAAPPAPTLTIGTDGLTPFQVLP